MNDDLIGITEPEYLKLFTTLGNSLYDLSKTISINDKYSIKDVNIIVPNKVVEITFVDGSKQKSICSDTDTFSLEMAISICLLKKILGGTSAYNKTIKDAIKLYNQKIQKTQKEKSEKEHIERKEKKLADKRAKRKANKDAAERERLIEIQKEAIIRANKEMSKSFIHNPSPLHCEIDGATWNLTPANPTNKRND